jgi:hypothetical protein
MAKQMSNRDDIGRLRRWEIFFEIALVCLLVITALAWGWQEFLIVLFLGGTIEWFISETKRKLEAQSFQKSIYWLKHRLEIVDPHGVTDFLQLTLEEPRLHPPADEIMVKCPKCNRAIKRRELDRPFNGGWSQAQT